MKPLLCLVTAVCTVLSVTAHPDEVLSLPGLTFKPNFRHYSGYLNATNGRKLHYWLVESQKDPKNDPLALWMNGGPGCSSVLGFLTEHGPFRVNGSNIIQNTFSWNQVANVLYLEAPAGVGFSYSLDKNYTTSDDQVSLDNYVALQSFFKKFPQFANSDFYITGESYGGIYVPTLSVRVLNGPAPINFKGFAVGNGLSSYRLNDNSIVFFAYYHGLLGKSLWNSLSQYCCKGGATMETCNFHDNTDPNCVNAVAEVANIVGGIGLDVYNLYSDCATTVSSKYSRLHADISHLFRKYKINWQEKLKKSTSQNVGIDPPCLSDGDVENYLNRQDVREAIHIPTFVQNFTACSAEVSAGYIQIYETMTDQYNILLKKVRGLVYNGDIDMACNFLGDEYFVDSLGRQVLTNYTHWKFNKQIAGFYKKFEGLDFVTIKGAGHMVPTDKAGPAFKMFANFLYQKSY